MHARYPLLLAIALTLSTSAAHADGPLVETWVELRIRNCQAVTFEAPEHGGYAYVAGDSYRTTMVTGDVTGAGMRDDYGTPEHRASAAADVLLSLPKQDASVSLVLSRWSPQFCSANHDKVVRFNYFGVCDTLPMRGPCLPPLRLAVPATCEARKWSVNDKDPDPNVCPGSS